MKKKIAVVGAGIFGITVALNLSKRFDVTLFEAKEDILMAASGINQFRVHRGYHYPRSAETIGSCLLSEPVFRKEYGEAFLDDFNHYYAIATDKSLTTAKDYLKVLKTFNLEHETIDLEIINKDSVSLVVKVRESLLDPEVLKKICKRRLESSSVELRLGTKADLSIYDSFDEVVVCTYSYNNLLLDQNNEKRDYQYELCEKIVVELPDEFKDISLVILDGPFMCFDPFGRTGSFLLGNVVEAIHQTNIGEAPKYDKKYEPFLNNGVVKALDITRFDDFIESTMKFIPSFNKAKYIGSMFTFRTVLPYKEKTDERPTMVNRIDEKTITVFSGKIVSCVQAANEVEALIK